MEVLDNIPVKLDFEVVSKKLRLRNKNEDVEKNYPRVNWDESFRR